MEIKSVNNSRQPNYPTIELFVKHPELLWWNIPGSWLKNKFVTTSLAAFLLSGCGTNTASKNEEVEIVDTLGTGNPMNMPQKKKADSSIVTNVAPVFAHGEGRGAIGCEVISPPVFISEDEAVKIILDKLRAEGYNFSKENCPTFSFEVLPLANECDEPKGKMEIKLKMDAYNPKSKWAIQFITTDDYDKFKNDDCWSTVSDYDTKEAAEIINQELKKQKQTNAVVFYDPITQINLNDSDDWKNYRENVKLAEKEARDLLLAQVNDFINWLKTNNITIE